MDLRHFKELSRCLAWRSPLPFAVAAGIIVGCSRERDVSAGDLVFQVDASLLGPAVADSSLGLRFAPPTRWKPISREALHAMQDRLHAQVATQAGPLMTPVHAFLDSSAGSACVLSRWSTASGDSIWIAILEQTRQSVARKFGPGSVKETAFERRGFTIFQFLVMVGDQVIFKLMLHRPAGPVCEVDYVTPRSVYPHQVKAIESSIGSLQPL